MATRKQSDSPDTEVVTATIQALDTHVTAELAPVPDPVSDPVPAAPVVRAIRAFYDSNTRRAYNIGDVVPWPLELANRYPQLVAYELSND